MPSPDDLPTQAPAPLSTASLKAPRAAAVAGILFSALLIASVLLVRISVPADPKEIGAWLSTRAGTVALALNLIPFSGVAFLWFIGVLRDRLGAREDRLFATVFLGSGLLFLGMLFVSAAFAGGILLTYAANPEGLVGSTTFVFARTVVYEIVNIYAIKMAAVFMVVTSTLALRTRLFARWLAFSGYAVALSLIASSAYVEWTLLVFPLWVLIVSVYILIDNTRPFWKRARR